MEGEDITHRVRYTESETAPHGPEDVNTQTESLGDQDSVPRNLPWIHIRKSEGTKVGKPYEVDDVFEHVWRVTC